MTGRTKEILVVEHGKNYFTYRRLHIVNTKDAERKFLYYMRLTDDIKRPFEKRKCT